MRWRQAVKQITHKFHLEMKISGDFIIDARLSSHLSFARAQCATAAGQ